MKKVEYKLNIFDVLKEIDNGNMSFYDKLPLDTKKAFSPILTHQWMCGYASKIQLEQLDYFVNTQLYTMYKYPAVLYKLMVCASDGNPKRYTYLKRKKVKTVPSIKLKTISAYLNCSIADAKTHIKVMDVEDIVEMGEEMGYDGKILKQIRK